MGYSENNIVLAALMVDEIKLKHGLYTNMITCEMIGFVLSDLTFESMNSDLKEYTKVVNQPSFKSNNIGSRILIIPKDDSFDEFDKKILCASYVNQFRSRTTRNMAVNLELFFNDCSLSGNEFTFQKFHVLLMLNNVNIRVKMNGMDDGVNNSRCLSLLRHEDPLGESGWFDNEKLVSFRDATIDHRITEHRTAVTHCSTHNQKNLHNVFNNSSESLHASRLFMSISGVRFTWKERVEECYLRDLINALPVTNVCKASVYPNGWNKMRVGLSLRPFNDKTLVEQFSYLGNILGCNSKIYFTGGLQDCKDVVKMYLKQAEILREVIKSKQRLNIKIPLSILI